ncbi:MAG: ATP-binding protein, partial [Thermoanaerobaculia bacterium]|nr:ATP-binding protein [Thermoanaerobaculia bacterium]
FLTQLTWKRALERVGSQVVVSLVAVGALLLLLVPWRRPAFGALSGMRSALRSYSTRLLVVYGLLLLVPLGLLELLLVRSFEERLRREQRMAGQAALTSARQVLGDFVLSLEPGFGIETALDDALLGWVSRVIHHEVNLYWGSSINASSKRELFSAGLLPARIPGEIHSRIAFGGDELAWRTTRAGDARYLEIYAPLRIPGRTGEAASRLVLSLPLLAQQEEIAEELAEMRRRSILLTLLVGLVAVLVGTRSARTFTRPLEALARGTERIASGASSLAMERPRDVEMATLVDAIDEMAGRISDARERLLREKEVVDRIVQHIATGVVSLDEEGRVLMINRLAREVLPVDLGQPLLAATRKTEGLDALTDFLQSSGGRLAEATVELGVDGGERDFRLVSVPVPGEGEPSSLLVLEDVTEVLRAQRLEAWAEMARVIAHEVKNPLTPIRLSAEHMREVYERDPASFETVFERCTDNILRQVEELRQIAGEFSTYSSIPVLSRERTNLVEVLERLAEGYRSAVTAGVEILFRPRVSRLEAEVDERLLRRAVRNLVENAVRACSNQGGGTVEIELAKGGEHAVIRVRDDGPGLEAELLPRIFDPNFSTEDLGTGLGLPIAQRVVEEHGGKLTARNRDREGLEMTIEIPLS